MQSRIPVSMIVLRGMLARHTKAALIYKQRGNLRAVQILFG
jgi:hypothetical protein